MLGRYRCNHCGEKVVLDDECQLSFDIVYRWVSKILCYFLPGQHAFVSFQLDGCLKQVDNEGSAGNDPDLDPRRQGTLRFKPHLPPGAMHPLLPRLPTTSGQGDRGKDPDEVCHSAPGVHQVPLRAAGGIQDQVCRVSHDRFLRQTDHRVHEGAVSQPETVVCVQARALTIVIFVFEPYVP